MEISVISRGSAPFGFGRYPIGVDIYQVGPVAPDTLNYRTMGGMRLRSRTETGAVLGGNISYFVGSGPLGFGGYQIGVVVYFGRSVSPDTLNYRAVGGNEIDRGRKLDLYRMEISVISGDSAPICFGRYPIGVGVFRAGI